MVVVGWGVFKLIAESQVNSSFIEIDVSVGVGQFDFLGSIVGRQLRDRNIALLRMQGCILGILLIKNFFF